MILQPRPSLVVVTVRPASSVWDELALATARPGRPEDEEDETDDEDETDTAEFEELRAEALAMPWPRFTRTPWRPGSGTVDRNSRPSARIWTKVQVPLGPPRRGAESAAAAVTAAAARATFVICGTAMARSSNAGRRSLHRSAAPSPLPQQRRDGRALAVELP